MVRFTFYHKKKEITPVFSKAKLHILRLTKSFDLYVYLHVHSVLYNVTRS
jgi:hypothetical protein